MPFVQKPVRRPPVRLVAPLLAITVAATVLLPAGARAATKLVVAAPYTCPGSAACAPALKRAYGLDLALAMYRYDDEDAGVAALDAGRAQAAIVLSSNASLSRPDLVTLHDDRHMTGAENAVPVLRTAVLRRFGARARSLLRRQVALTSSLLTDRDLRDMSEFASQRRLAEAIAGEWVEAHGLAAAGRTVPRVRGPRIVLGYQDFSTSELLTQVYALALRAAGFDVAVKPVGGVIEPVFKAYAKRQIDGHVGFASTLLRRWDRATTARTLPAVSRALAGAAARRGLTTLAPARAESRLVFVMRRGVAAELHVIRISDLKAHWPTNAAASTAARAADSAEPALTLAASQICAVAVFCAPGLARVYGLDVSSRLVTVTGVDGEAKALDSGRADVGATFSSAPATRRPDMVVLRDDKRMATEDRVVAVARRRALRSLGRRFRTLVDGATREVTLGHLQRMRHDRLDGTSVDAVATAFADQQGLTGVRRSAPRGAVVHIAYDTNPDNEDVAHVWGAVLRAAGYAVRYRVNAESSIEPVLTGLRRGSIDLVATQRSASLLVLNPKADVRKDVTRQLDAALRRDGATPLAASPARLRRVYLMLAPRATQLGITKISDLARFFPKAK